jgi:DNA-binding IclR family transcriptional regulator
MTQLLQTRRIKEALARVRDLFAEPGATLTTAGAAQMAGLDRQVCRGLLQNLVEAGFLERRPRGGFARSPSLHTRTVRVEDRDRR